MYSFDRASKWGVWSPNKGLDILPIDKWEMRKDLTGVHFKTTTATEPPYVTTEKANLSNIENWPNGYIVSHSYERIQIKTTLIISWKLPLFPLQFT